MAAPSGPRVAVWRAPAAAAGSPSPLQPQKTQRDDTAACNKTPRTVKHFFHLRRKMSLVVEKIVACQKVSKEDQRKQTLRSDQSTAEQTGPKYNKIKLIQQNKSPSTH